VKLTKLPKGRFKVRIVTTFSNGARRTSTRTYKGCTKGRPSTSRG
jgi:hypothetical protein